MWDEKKISDFSVLVTKGTTPTSIGCGFEESGINYIKSESIGQGRRLDRSKYAFISDETHEKLKRSQIQEGDILFSMAGAYLGKTGIVTSEDVPANTNQAVAIIRLDRRKVNPEFVYYVLNQSSMIARVNSSSSQSAQPNINLKDIGNLSFLCPERMVQDKIVSLLSNIDSKIENNEKLNRNLEEQLAAIYNEWFGKYKPFNIGIGRDPGYELEEDWQIKDIYSVANIIYGAPFASKLFNTEGEGTPIVRIRDLKNQELGTYTTEQHPKGYLIQQGDIVVGMDGEFRPYIWGNDEAWLNQRVCVFDSIRENGKAYLYCTIKPLLYSVEATEVATTVIHIGKKDYDEFRVVLPPEDVMNEFEMISRPMYDQIVEGQVENRRLAKLRDSLLPKLMSGELDVSDLDI